MVSDYYATGEGRTVSIMITSAFPLPEDYLKKPHMTETGWNSGTLKNTQQERAIREFQAKFGSWIAKGVEILDRYEFFHNYGTHVPEYVYKLTDPDDQQAPYFSYHAELHVNFS